MDEKSNPPVFTNDIYSMSAEQWTIVMSHNFIALFISRSLILAIVCMFLRGGPAVWFETIVEPQLYRWNKFRYALERTFGDLGAPWESRIVNEFGNSTDDSSDGGFGRKEEACPANV